MMIEVSLSDAKVNRSVRSASPTECNPIRLEFDRQFRVYHIHVSVGIETLPTVT